MSAFDSLADLAVDVTSSIMGNTATWVKDGSHTYTALVKYRDEKGESKLGDKNIPIDQWSIEIKNSDFPGLKGLVDLNKKPTITVTVRGEDLVFNATTVTALSDGLCSRIGLRLKSSL